MSSERTVLTVCSLPSGLVAHTWSRRVARGPKSEPIAQPRPVQSTRAAISNHVSSTMVERTAWYDAAADEFARVFATPRGRMAFFSAARQIYLEEAHGEQGFWERLPALSRPALFLWGDRDRLVPCGFARHVTAALPAVRSRVLEDCGHVPQFEQPERTHLLVREFLAAGDR